MLKIIVFFIFLLNIPAVSAMTDKGSLILVVTKNHKPVFMPVEWNIKCKKKHGRYEIKLKRHAISIDLEPANCSVKVTVDKKSKTRNITIIGNRSHSLIININ